MLNQISKGPQNLCFNKWGGLQSTLEVDKHLKCGLSMGAGVEVKTGESKRIKVRHTHPQCTLNRSYRQDSCVDRVMPGMENRGWRREMGAGGPVRVTPRVSSHKGNALAGCIPSRRSELPVPPGMWRSWRSPTSLFWGEGSGRRPSPPQPQGPEMDTHLPNSDQGPPALPSKLARVQHPSDLLPASIPNPDPSSSA